jgi:hypothetical protein
MLLAELSRRIDLNGEIPERLATAWAHVVEVASWRPPIASDSNSSIGSIDTYGRWFPEATSPGRSISADDAVRNIQAVHLRMGATYELPFPVVGALSHVHGVILSRVTRLKPDPSLEALPKLVLAPWSEYLLHPTNMEALGARIGHPETRRILELPLDDHYLLDLVAPPKAAPVARGHVEGNSLDLAVLLAGYASSTDWPSLRPLVSTGELHIENSSVEIVDVGDLSKKWQAVRTYAEARHEKVILLVPKGASTSYGTSDWVEIKNFPETVVELRKELGTSLSDGCDAYRQYLDQLDAIEPGSEEGSPEASSFLEADIEALDSACRLVSGSEPLDCETSNRLSVHIIPFGNDTRQAALHVAHGIAKNAVPLLLSLEAANAVFGSMDAKAVTETLLAQIKAGLKLLQEDNSAGRSAQTKDSLIADDALRNLVLFTSTRVVYLLYGGRSLTNSYIEGRIPAMIASLRRHSPKASALVLASDLHHASWLATLGLVKDDGFLSLVTPKEKTDRMSSAIV